MGYLIWLVYPASALVGCYIGGAYTWLAFGLTFALLPLVDYWVGVDSSTPKTGTPVFPISLATSIVAVVLYYTFVGLVLYSLRVHEHGVVSFVGICFSASAISGIFMSSLSHEISHKDGEIFPYISIFMLSPIGYSHHVVEHLYSHHHFAGTSKDPATARYHQSLYSFLIQTLKYGTYGSFRYEFFRLRKKGGSPVSFKNRVAFGWLLTLALWAAAISQFGPRGLVFLMCHALLSIIWIETLNYIEHYGLKRQKNKYNRYQEFGPKHAWDSDHLISNLVLLRQGRHSSHHIDPKRPFYKLEGSDKSPKLPFGYLGMVLIAFVPPLWSYIMDPLAQRIRRKIPLWHRDSSEEDDDEAS